MDKRMNVTDRRAAWCALLGAACLAAWLPVQAADAPRPPASPADPAGGQIRTIVRTVVQRAMLGMAIDLREAGPGGEGVRVIGVSPGGAAESAGIKPNDVVISLDGKPLRGEPNHSAQQQLLDISRAASPGEPMAIEYRRDGKVIKTQIVPRITSESIADTRLPGMPDIPDMPVNLRMLRFQGPDAGGFGGTQLVELTPGLGSYFGTEKGLLVVRAPQDARFKLQDGDVIVDIDGRVPQGLPHAFQILGSYRPGETVKLRILRQKKRMELAVEVPPVDAPHVLHQDPAAAAPPGHTAH